MKGPAVLVLLPHLEWERGSRFNIPFFPTVPTVLPDVSWACVPSPESRPAPSMVLQTKAPKGWCLLQPFVGHGALVLPGGHLREGGSDQGPVFVSSGPPDFEEELADCTAELGETVKLACRVTGTPKPIVSWYKGKLLGANPATGKSHPEGIRLGRGSGVQGGV